MKLADRDYVQYLAEEKAKDRRATKRRRIFWQTSIFMIALFINCLVTFRQKFDIDEND
jgi:hypothetical protein